MCTGVTPGSTCPYGSKCEHAHSVQELRADAAISFGHLGEEYKTQICARFLLGERSCDAVLCSPCFS